MEVIDGRITKVDAGGVTIYCPYTNIDRLCLRQYDFVQVTLPDGRSISPQQRKKAWALLGEIAEYSGFYDRDEINEHVYLFHVRRFLLIHPEIDQDRFRDKVGREHFLSRVDMTTAREFITYLIATMIREEIPSSFPLYEYTEDIPAYVYACLFHKKCAVCGKQADLHHVDRIGMGRNRDDVRQIGMLVLPLCREHHGLCHSEGEKVFLPRFHLEPIELTVEIADKYPLTAVNKQEMEVVPNGIP